MSVIQASSLTASYRFSPAAGLWARPLAIVGATSASSGAFTYVLVSGPATVSGTTVTISGAGTVVLSVTQAASGSYPAATQNTTFTVGAAVPSLSFASIASQNTNSIPFSVSASSASTGTITYAVTSGPTTIAGSTVTQTGVGTGLPAGASATFSPAMIVAGSGPTTVTLTVQTSNQASIRERRLPFGPMVPAALGLLLPFVGMRGARRRLGKSVWLFIAMVVLLGTTVALGGCGGSSSTNTPAQSYTMVVTAVDTTTGAHTSIDLSLTVK